MAALAGVALRSLAAPLRRTRSRAAPRCPVDRAEDARPASTRCWPAQFATQEKVEYWGWKAGDQTESSSGLLGEFGVWLARGFAELVRVGTWALLALAAVVLVVLILRALRAQGAHVPVSESEESPLRRGLDLRPESLPDDVVAAARARFAAGDATGALSLLYRGALVQLAKRFELRLPASATEGSAGTRARRTRRRARPRLRGARARLALLRLRASAARAVGVRRPLRALVERARSGGVNRTGVARWIALAALLGLGAFVFETSCERRTLELPTGYRGEAARNKYLAAERLLQRMGMPAKSFVDASRLARMPPTKATIVIPTRRHTLGERTSERLLQWVEAGGTSWW